MLIVAFRIERSRRNSIVLFFFAEYRCQRSVSTTNRGEVFVRSIPFGGNYWVECNGSRGKTTLKDAKGHMLCWTLDLYVVRIKQRLNKDIPVFVVVGDKLSETREIVVIKPFP